MKERSAELKRIFTLLMIAAVLAIAAGAYLGIVLGMQIQALASVLSAAGILIWTIAWGAFILLCLQLRKGASAFRPFTGKILTVIGVCLTALAAIALACAMIAGSLGRGQDPVFLAIETVLLPGFFLAAAVAAWILRALLSHAIAIEKEQEGVV